MRGIRCICLNDKGKPNEIPSSKWLKKDNEYHITHLYVMAQQGKIQGCELAELDISDCIPYNCFRLSRFAINKDDFKKLLQLAKDCSDLDSISNDEIRKFVEQIEIEL